jgi:hypothetical protein
MSTYKDAVEYFKSLAIANVDIAHTEAEGNKKFFRLDMAEFYSGTVAQLPSAEAGPFMVLFNYITDFSRIDCVNQKKQFMFMILQAYSKDDWNAEEDALDLCENVIKEVVNKINFDSKTYSENEFLYGGFEYENVRLIPSDKIRNSTGLYIGWQCSFFLNERISVAIDPTKWITPEP